MRLHLLLRLITLAAVPAAVAAAAAAPAAAIAACSEEELLDGGCAYAPGSIPVAVVACSAPAALRSAVESLSRADGFAVEQLHVFQDAVGRFPKVTAAVEALVRDGLLLKENWHTHSHDDHTVAVSVGSSGGGGSSAEDSEGGEDSAEAPPLPPDKHVLIARHYRHVLTTMFESDDRRLASSRHVIVLEEDLIVSRDFLRYFEAVAAPLLDADKGATLLAASAWNDHGFVDMVLPDGAYDYGEGEGEGDGSGTGEEDKASGGGGGGAGGGGGGGENGGGGGATTSVDRLGVHRAEHFPGLGWLCPRRLWEEELRGAWPDFIWDVWMRTPAVAKGRHTVVPETPRSHHTGRGGTSIAAWMRALMTCKF